MNNPNVDVLLERQKQLLKQLENALGSLQLRESFQKLKASCEHLQDRLDHEEFRIAIVGEFSTGKSTLINALIAEPDVLPTDELPCTSQDLEIHFGETLRCIELNTGREYSDVRQALKQHATVSKGGSLQARRWRIECPSPLLAQGLVCIDTPGIGEDTERKELAFEEAGKADAVVLVTRASKLGSESETELVEFLARKRQPVILAINCMDQVRSKPSRFRERAEDMFPEITPQNIVLLSGLKAHEESKHGTVDGKSKWTDLLAELRDAISVVLQENSAGERIRQHQKELERIDAGLRDEIELLVAEREREGKLVLERIEQIEDALRKGISPLQKALKASFHASWPGILNALDGEKSKWKSEHSPITSPKKYAMEIAEQAKRYIERRVQGWANNQGKRVTEQQIQRKFDEIEPLVVEITTYLNTSGSAPKRLKNTLLNRVMRSAFSKSIEGAADDAAWATIVSAIISVIVGYIIADVILFYVLALISGFLNPVLLAAAAVVGLAAFFFGADWVGDYVKSKIVEKINEELSKPEAIKKINEGFGKAAHEVFEPLAKGFGKETRKMKSEAEAQINEATETASRINKALVELHALF